MGINSNQPSRLHNLEALTSSKRNNIIKSPGIALSKMQTLMVKNHSANEISFNTHNNTIVKYKNPLEDK
jgi:hypothetical protein